MQQEEANLKKGGEQRDVCSRGRELGDPQEKRLGKREWE